MRAAVHNTLEHTRARVAIDVNVGKAVAIGHRTSVARAKTTRMTCGNNECTVDGIAVFNQGVGLRGLNKARTARAAIDMNVVGRGIANDFFRDGEVIAAIALSTKRDATSHNSPRASSCIALPHQRVFHAAIKHLAASELCDQRGAIRGG